MALAHGSYKLPLPYTAFGSRNTADNKDFYINNLDISRVQHTGCIYSLVYSTGISRQQAGALDFS